MATVCLVAYWAVHGSGLQVLEPGERQLVQNTHKPPVQAGSAWLLGYAVATQAAGATLVLRLPCPRMPACCLLCIPPAAGERQDARQLRRTPLLAGAPCLLSAELTLLLCAATPENVRR